MDSVTTLYTIATLLGQVTAVAKLEVMLVMLSMTSFSFSLVSVSVSVFIYLSINPKYSIQVTTLKHY